MHMTLPQIDVHVVHAEGQPTVAALVYNESFSGQRADVPKPPVYLYGRESCISLSCLCIVSTWVLLTPRLTWPYG